MPPIAYPKMYIASLGNSF